MRAQASNLTEELGQVEYVFSDKTGTLTCNIMSFKKFTAGLDKYGKNKEGVPGFYDSKLEKELDNMSDSSDLKKFIMFMAVCHTIIIDVKTGQFNASSPDELALVEAAKEFGFEFKGLDSNNVMTIHEKRSGIDHYFTLLNICEFTSTRKRMSVIVKDSFGQIRLLCKGADSVIEERLSQESLRSKVFKETTRHVNDFAREGLRTLYLAEKVLDQYEYDQWNEEFV